jgi:hypothetical protein
VERSWWLTISTTPAARQASIIVRPLVEVERHRLLAQHVHAGRRGGERGGMRAPTVGAQIDTASTSPSAKIAR